VPILDGQALGVMEVSRTGSWAVGRLSAHEAMKFVPRAPGVCPRSFGIAPGDPGLRGAGLRRSRLRRDGGQRTVQRDHRGCGFRAVALARSPTAPRGARSRVGFDDLIEEILAGARLRAHGIRRNRRTDHRTFEGPDRRATAALAATDPEAGGRGRKRIRGPVPDSEPAVGPGPATDN